MERRIPGIFRSEEDGKPIACCVHCGKNLEESFADYVVEKTYKIYELDGEKEENNLFEYALCEDCMRGMKQHISKESAENMEELMRDCAAQREQEDDSGQKDWLEHCLITGKNKGDCREYTVCGYFTPLGLHPIMPPFMISGEGREIMASQLSKKTRDGLDGFSEGDFGGPPELREIFRSKPIIF